MNKTLHLLNSSTKKIENIDKKEISIYLCGPTVYNYVHIGNIRPIVIYDVLHRVLIAQEIKVNFVHNITDIDDKIINKAIELNLSEKEISSKYLNHYKNILKNLNILPVNMPLVSDNINEMISYIKYLYDNNFAYKLNDDIYFSLQKIKNYGTVSNMEISKLNIGERVINESRKKTPNDFILWKKTTKGITWESPMGNGRPGWHTECCVLINKFIGDQVDIHGGGIDLRFPHHENENIQNIAKYNKNIAKVWSHIGHVMIMDQKMSKSLDNFILVKDLFKIANSNSIRWMFYQTKYEKPLNYSNEMINESNKAIEKLEHELNRAYSYLIINNKYQKINLIPKKVFEILNNDLDLPNLITFIYEKNKMFSQNISKRNFEELNENYNHVKNTLNLIGIKFDPIHNEENIKLLNEWNDSLKNKNFKKADELRNNLIKIKLL